MSNYKKVSNTSSGWEISTDPEAPPEKRWYGEEKFFERRDMILEWTCKDMVERALPILKARGWMR